MTRIISLCSGYGGLDLAAEALTGGTTVAHVEFDAAPSRILAARWPDVPNLNDVKALTWADLDADVLTAGYPCQPFSGAGKRLGTEDPRHLFPSIARGVERMRPPLLLLENVRGHLTLGFDVVLAELDRIGYDARWTLLRAADVGAPHGRARLWIAARDRDAGGFLQPMGDPTAIVVHGVGWVRAQGGLFGDVEAVTPGPSGVMSGGARWDADVALPLHEGLFRTPTAQLAINGGSQHPDKRKAGGHGPTLADEVEHLLPTPTTQDAANTGGPSQLRRNSLPLNAALLPTPAVNDMGAGKTVEAWDAWTEAQRAKHGNGNGHGPSLHIEAARLAQGQDDLLPTPTAGDSGTSRAHARGNPTLQGAVVGFRNSDTARLGGPAGQLLPTPRATDGEKGGPNQADSSGDLMLPSAVQPDRWGVYAAAVARWEAMTRPAPPPTEPGRNGAPRLSPAFVEWMMGLPSGWVTDVPGITRNHALKALGNGVVPQQAAAAFRLLLGDLTLAVAA